MKPLLFSALFISVGFTSTSAQDKTSGEYTLEGTITNEKNGNFLPDVQITIYDDKTYAPIAHTITDGMGNYKVTVPTKERFRVESKKSTYFKGYKVIDTADSLKSPQNITMTNKPGYIFDVTIFDKAHQHMAINSLADCKIEIYNNTTKEQELTIPKHPKSVFNFPFHEGNHYTVLVRKPGYINRRIEVFVNINGCILCVDGMGVKEPDVVALMTHENETGFFLGNIDLDSIKIGKKFVIPHIYYDFDKWNIRPDAAKILDKLAIFLKDNPAVKVELGSHTDVRGSDSYNMTLSDKRAESAVQYLVDNHGISRENLTWKGYGETELVNACVNGANCSETEHQKNRRTELKITGYSDEDPLWKYSLKQIIEDKDLYKKIIKQEKPGQPKTGSVSLN
jgi:outer membrane protein OmpA-like peptidoglycan-associated protein